MSKRNPSILGIWGDNGTRVVASDAMWREPLKWNRAAADMGLPARVFCASLADVCEDRPELESPRQRLRELIAKTPMLNWLLLTKRPQNYERFFPDAPPNVWKGTSVEDQETADERIPRLLRSPATIHFVSYEPALGPVDFAYSVHQRRIGDPQPDWIIIGGESGTQARPFNVEWARQAIKQCKADGVACFMKQLGAFSVWDGCGLVADNPKCKTVKDYVSGVGEMLRLITKDSHGGNMDEWPEDLRVRQFPTKGPSC